MLDLIKLISDPLLKDGIAVIAIAFTGLFILLKHLLKFISTVSTKKEPDETRMEKYLRTLIDKFEKEKLSLLEDVKKLQIDMAEKNNSLVKAYMKLKIAKNRITYLEYKLREHNILVSPQMDNLDD